MDCAKAIEFFVANANAYNEWSEAAMWQNVSHVVRLSHRDPERRWTNEELSEMISKAEQQ
jgi:hypothetical protein